MKQLEDWTSLMYVRQNGRKIVKVNEKKLICFKNQLVGAGVLKHLHTSKRKTVENCKSNNMAPLRFISLYSRLSFLIYTIQSLRVHNWINCMIT